jgi:hypothetical protein
MGFFKRLFKQNKIVEKSSCPRCLGKGHVDTEDIIRLKKNGEWDPGPCAYCNASGSVDKGMLFKVAVDAGYLTADLSEEERNAIINTDYKLGGCPVTEYNRLWLEKGFLLLVDFFGENNIRQRKVLVPDPSDFPVAYNNTEQSAFETIQVVATQMEVSFEDISLDIYEDLMHEISTGNPFGRGIFMETDKDALHPTGLYWGKNAQGKFEISLNRKKLSEPESMVAVLAHEIAHIKLLGENLFVENNEPFTDLTTVVFGFGIFNANDAFRFSKNFDSWQARSEGYLSQPQWGYALALFAHVRGEKSPEWINYLTPNIKSDFLLGQDFIGANPDLIFQMRNRAR